MREYSFGIYVLFALLYSTNGTRAIWELALSGAGDIWKVFEWVERHGRGKDTKGILAGTLADWGGLN